MDKARLLKHLRGQFKLDWHGHHGASHWSRVRHNGLLLAEANGAQIHVVELFAFFHDARRVNEYEDPDHGKRGAELALKLRGRFFDLGRVHVRPNPRYLCTKEAKRPEVIADAYARSVEWLHRRGRSLANRLAAE
jgi:hypothetical protein